MTAREEGGFSLIEILVGAAVFSLVGTAFVSMMFSVARGTRSTADSVRISEEARLGLNRLVRDVREAGWVELAGTDPSATHNSFTVKIDYNADGAFANPATGTAQGSYEVVTYAYDASTRRITLTAPGVGTETLVSGVDCVRDLPAGPCASDVFSFTSNRLEYDWNNDGVATLAEVNAAACPPNNLTMLDSVCNGALVEKELATLTSVNVAVELTAGGRSTDYVAEAQLRNRR